MGGRFLELAYQQIRAQAEESAKSGELPDDISLQFQNLEMQNVPPELLEVLNHQVLKLSFNHNLLRTVPPLPNLTRLFYLDLSENRFSHVPLAICELRSLEILDLSQNFITRLPRELANLQSLKVLSLSQNELHYLPTTLTSLKALEYFEVDDNPLVFPREDILRLAQDQDDWLPALRQHLLENRDKIEKLEQSLAANEAVHEIREPPHLERSRSSSEGYLHNRNKRMGFVMQRNASGSVYMAGLHARGLSVDSVLIDGAGPAQASSFSLNERPADLNTQTTSSLTSHSDPGISPRGSPLIINPSAVAASDDEDKESPLSSSDTTGNRLFTLQEEEADAEPAEVVPKVPQKSQNRSRGNSAATTQSVAQVEPPVPPLVTPNIPGYQKLLASLNGFVDASNRLNIPGDPRFTSLVSVCQDSNKALEKALEQERDLAGTAHRAITGASDLVAYLNLPAVLNQVVHESSLGPVRSLILQLVHSFAELNNANSDLESPKLSSPGSSESGTELKSAQSSAGLAHADEQLYQQLEHAVKTLQGVVSLFNKAIAHSATVSVEVNGAGTASSSENAGLAAYVGELSSACIDCVAMTKQLKQSLDHRNSRGIPDRRAFWEDVNSFLKSIVTLLAAAKSAVVEIPLLADSGSEMSALARVAKEVPPLLEQSSYRLHLDAGARLERPRLPSNQSSAPSSGTPTVTTPFIAALGTAAQELLSPGLQTPGLQTPFEGGPS
ncbi:Leucine-rich repeat-containing protein sog2 [Wickerhamiella sorbophila]|uniref:Leucine-rich repeat-containing protein sog2 n=1 Tax=Wickerhamiella sorbophila TaxID=45607 RepID=A0A2T0FFL1_9ASCO|nr:Leucine-rich repeat-containing protein sog2 [Wickerhamiella sorbophila]PRT53757.1 Leucine-rich repeat-containing protein sog2 [Wickerhamiella sorbophila]